MLDLSHLTEPSETKTKQLIESHQFSGLDGSSVRKLIFSNSQAFIAALSQKFYDLLLYPLRAGWSANTTQQRNSLPWLSAALEWGIQAEELYDNAHGLPAKHPLKNTCLLAAHQMDNWEKQHGFWAAICAYSRPLDQLVGQPVPVGPDGWPVNQLNSRGGNRDLSDIYSEAALFYHRHRPKTSPSLQHQISHLASESFTSGRLTLLAS